jgi:ABC-type phosphate/phosphonate transport system substrate-binding protein
MPRDKKANQIILKLFFGQADIICLYQNSYRLAIELNPQIGEKLQIISQLDGIPQGAGLFHKSVPREFRDRVSTNTLKLGTYARGKQLLQLFKADKVVRSTLSDLTATKRLYSAYKKLRKSK